MLTRRGAVAFGVGAELVNDLGEPCVVRYGERTLALNLPRGGRRTLTPADFAAA